MPISQSRVRSTRYWLPKLLYSFVRTEVGATLLGWVMRYASWLLPVNQLAETRTLMAFSHPIPSYPFHVIFLPKKPYRSLMDLPQDDPVFLNDVLVAAQSLVEKYHLEKNGYRLVINGGQVQDVPLLHIHLIGENHD